MHERRGVGVGDVELIPDVAQLALLEVARDQRGLASARGRAQPDDRSRRGFVEKREQSRPRQRVVDLGPREFGESG